VKFKKDDANLETIRLAFVMTEACNEVVERLRARGLGPDAVYDILMAAYGMALCSTGMAFGYNAGQIHKMAVEGVDAFLKQFAGRSGTTKEPRS
jgi:hypothetical protein